MEELKNVNGCCAPSLDICVRSYMKHQYLICLDILRKPPFTKDKWEYCEAMIDIIMRYYDEDQEDPLS